MRSSVLIAAFLALALSLVAPALAQQVPIPASPTQWVTDTVGILSPTTQSDLNQRLANYQRATGHQIIVWIGSSTGDTALEQWTIDAFTKWKVGRKGIDDGAILFLFTQDRRARIEVGYGLEGTLTDAISSEIIRHDIEPQMRANNPDGAVTSAVSDILAVVGGENGASPVPRAQTATSQTQSFYPLFVWVFVFIIILILVTRMSRRGPYIIGSPWIGSGWGGFSSGGFGGGGGFSGGGGMGGGGGASGGW